MGMPSALTPNGSDSAVAGVGLGRDGVAQVLEAVEDVHRAVLDAVLVAGDQAAADPPVVGVLAGVVEQAGAGVQPPARCERSVARAAGDRVLTCGNPPVRLLVGVQGRA
jgi:hypothetical protein